MTMGVSFNDLGASSEHCRESFRANPHSLKLHKRAAVVVRIVGVIAFVKMQKGSLELRDEVRLAFLQKLDDFTFPVLDTILRIDWWCDGAIASRLSVQRVKKSIALSDQIGDPFSCR